MTLPVSEGQPSFYQNVSGRIRQEQSGPIEFHDDDGIGDGDKSIVVLMGTNPALENNASNKTHDFLGFDRILGPNVRQKEEARASFARQVFNQDHCHYHCHPSPLLSNIYPIFVQVLT